MYKIAILGCENSHAAAFLTLIQEKYPDIEVSGVFSIYPEAAEALREKFNVPVMESFDSLVGKIDGLIITARDGKYHYPYAAPYIKTGIPMFLDKPITVSEEDARALVTELKANSVRVCGGSSLKHGAYLARLKEAIASGDRGKVLGGAFRAPVSLENEYGGFFFYGAHIVSMMTEVFGYDPESVFAARRGDCVDCLVSYPGVNVGLQYVNGNYVYHASLSFERGIVGGDVNLDGCYDAEFSQFYGILTGKTRGESYEDIIASVFIMNAIYRSLASGKPETIGKL